MSSAAVPNEGIAAHAASLAEIGLEERRMLPENAAALVGAGMVSVLPFPLIALQLRGRHVERSPASASREGF